MKENYSYNFGFPTSGSQVNQIGNDGLRGIVEYNTSPFYNVVNGKNIPNPFMNRYSAYDRRLYPNLASRIAYPSTSQPYYPYNDAGYINMTNYYGGHIYTNNRYRDLDYLNPYSNNGGGYVVPYMRHNEHVNPIYWQLGSCYTVASKDEQCQYGYHKIPTLESSYAADKSKWKCCTRNTFNL